MAGQGMLSQCCIPVPRRVANKTPTRHICRLVAGWLFAFKLLGIGFFQTVQQAT